MSYVFLRLKLKESIFIFKALKNKRNTIKRKLKVKDTPRKRLKKDSFIIRIKEILVFKARVFRTSKKRKTNSQYVYGEHRVRRKINNSFN